MTPDDYLQRALELHQTGQYTELAVCCRKILDETPSHPQALHLFAVAEYHLGRQEMAVKLLDAALRYHPTDVDIHNSLGVFLRVLGRHTDAERHLRLALDLAPDQARLWNNLGILLRETDRLGEAIESYQTALRHDSQHVGAYFNLANSLWADGDLQQAASCYERTLTLNPEIIEARSALGGVMLQMGRNEQALDVLQLVVTERPDLAQATSDLACALMNLEQTEEALPWLLQAVDMDVDDGRSWYALGCIQLKQFEYADAVHSFTEAMRAAPDNAELQHNLGTALCELGDVDAAMQHFHKAISLGKLELSLRAIAVMIPAAPSADNAKIYKLRQAFTERFLPCTTDELPGRNSRSAAKRIRIGFLSSFFGKDNWMKPVWALVNAHDREDFEIHLFSDCRRDQIQYGYRAHEQDVFHDISLLSNQSVCDLMRRESIDVLVDLNAYSRPSRLPLLSLRPAPVVAAWFNMYATSAIDGVDYIIGDEIVAPPEEDQYYTEHVLRLPGSYLTFTVEYPVPDVQPAPCLDKGYITFGSLASQYKITPLVLDAWAKILVHTDARLLLRNSALGRGSNRQYISDQFQKRGVDCERITLLGPAKHFEFLQTYDRIDVALDTFPYNGGTTTMEALWQGVPMLTFLGDRWVARTSASLLANTELNEFVRPGLREYCERATALARDPDRHAQIGDLRQQLRQKCQAGIDSSCDGFFQVIKQILT